MFKLYVSKLNPGFNHLWQHPKQGRHQYTDEVWYNKVVVGHNLLERFMVYLSKDANLSQRYTNHCIRHTVMDTLDKKNFEARHMMAIFGHRSESSIKKYAKRCPLKKNWEMSDRLAQTIAPKKTKTETSEIAPLQNVTNTVPTATVTKDNQN